MGGKGPMMGGPQMGARPPMMMGGMGGPQMMNPQMMQMMQQKGANPQMMGMMGKGGMPGMPMGQMPGMMRPPMPGQGAPGARPPMPQPQPMQGGGAPLNASQLAAAPPAVQKQMIGEKLYPAIAKYKPEMAGKITGMMLEMDNS